VPPTDFETLVPKGVAAEVVATAADEASALMQLSNVVRMPSGASEIPVVSGSPASGFVSPVYGGLKPHGDVTWSSETLTAAEIGVVSAVPDAFIADTSFSVWDSVKSEIIKSFVRVFEQAALYGTNAPAEWPTGGLTAAAQADAITGADPLAAIDAAMSHLEAAGITPSGILGGSALRAALRAQTVTIMQPFSEAPAQLFGVPIAFSSNWNDTVGLALVGGYESVVVGIREDMTFTYSTDGVISDDAGVIVLNALQSDSSILRTYWRVGLQALSPLGPAGTAIKPLALAKVGSPVATEQGTTSRQTTRSRS
jgi:HK97 family phage major capsid protein